MKRLLQHPLLHFLLLGAAILVVKPEPQAGREPIIVDTGEVEALRADFMETHGRPPSQGEIEALVRDAIDDEILFRRARELGLDRDNPFVEYRLATLMRFVTDDPGRSDDVLAVEGRTLGLDRSDLVIRRHLVETVRLLAQQPARPEPVAEELLRERYEALAGELREPPRTRFSHVFFSRSRRGNAVVAEAEAALASLRSAPDSAERPGDPFLHGYDFPPFSPGEIDRRFGPGFAEALRALPAGEWSGPVESSYGVHLVRVDARSPEATRSFEAVRDRLRARIENERAAERLERRLKDWRRAAPIRIEVPGLRIAGIEDAP